MNKKNIIRILFALVIGLVLYNSFYIRDLEKIREEARLSEFNINSYVEDFWNNELMVNLDKASEIDMIIGLLNTNMDEALEYSNTLGVASVHSYLLKGTGRIVEINEDNIIVETELGNRIEITTDFIFGNSVRDASGAINVSDFPNTMAFNNISELINEKIVTEVVNPIVDKLIVNEVIEFVAATDISEVNPELNPLKAIPIKLEAKSK